MEKITSFVLASFLSLALAFPAIAASSEDTQNPSDVENLQATGLDAAVKLTWDEATDDTGVDGYQVHYGLKSVTKKGEAYDQIKEVGDVTEYTLTGLENGTTYYFSVIAFDAAGNESIAWAPEASAAPEAGSGSSDDTDAPTVSKAEAINKVEVKVEFSEEIVLPSEDPQDAFGIENSENFEPLAVTAAIMDEEDDSKKTVVLTTAEQGENVEYKLTVGIAIKDKAGNPIISGTSDTAIFKGSGEEKEPEDTEGPELTKVEVIDNTHIGVSFNETVVLGIDPSANFQINVEADQTKQLDVLKVKLGDDSQGTKDAFAVLTTGPQEKVKYVVMAVNVKDEAENTMNAGKNSAVFEGVEVQAPAGDDDDDTADDDTGTKPPSADTVAPIDVANFLAKAVADGQKYIVNLTWTIPEGLNDSVKQNLYLSKDKGGTYEAKSEFTPDKTGFEFPEQFEPGEYWVKLTQKDEAGNESKGAVIEVVLAETGPGLVGLVLVSLGLGRVFGKRRKK